MEANIFQGRISELKIEEIIDDDANISLKYAFKLNEKEFFFESEREMDLRNSHYLIISAESTGKIIAFYNTASEEKYGKKWQQLKKIKPKTEPLFLFKEGIVEQKQFIQERVYNSQRKYSNTLKYYKITVNGDVYRIGNREGKLITPRDKIAFLHPENKTGMAAFHNFSTGQNTLSIYPVNIIIYSVLLFCSVAGALLLRLSANKTLQFSLGIFFGICFIASALYLWDAIATRSFEKKRMQELLLKIN